MKEKIIKKFEDKGFALEGFDDRSLEDENTNFTFYFNKNLTVIYIDDCYDGENITLCGKNIWELI